MNFKIPPFASLFELSTYMTASLSGTTWFVYARDSIQSGLVHRGFISYVFDVFLLIVPFLSCLGLLEMQEKLIPFHIIW